MKRKSKPKHPPLPKDITISSKQELEEMEADPRFQELMRQADEDERQGRWTSMKEVVREMAASHGRRR